MRTILTLISASALALGMGTALADTGSIPKQGQKCDVRNCLNLPEVAGFTATNCRISSAGRQCQCQCTASWIIK